jgi:hypothetical protein
MCAGRLNGQLCTLVSKMLVLSDSPDRPALETSKIEITPEMVDTAAEFLLHDPLLCDVLSPTVALLLAERTLSAVFSYERIRE